VRVIVRNPDGADLVVKRIGAAEALACLEARTHEVVKKSGKKINAIRRLFHDDQEQDEWFDDPYGWRLPMPKPTIYNHETDCNPPRVFAHRPIHRLEHEIFLSPIRDSLKDPLEQRRMREAVRALHREQV
jgi:hypothetical protein